MPLKQFSKEIITYVQRNLWFLSFCRFKRNYLYIWNWSSCINVMRTRSHKLAHWGWMAKTCVDLVYEPLVNQVTMKLPYRQNSKKSKNIQHKSLLHFATLCTPMSLIHHLLLFFPNLFKFLFWNTYENKSKSNKQQFARSGFFCLSYPNSIPPFL